MSKRPRLPDIRLRGVRHNNLKNFDLDLPQHRLIVVTGLSGSGKSSLAFDTLFAEGQRRYIETFSPYARQFFDRMDKPRVESVENIPPAIALEQRNAVRTTRSTVGTMTEVCDYLKVLWPHVATLHCSQCRKPVGADSPQKVWQAVMESARERGAAAASAMVTFDLTLSDKISLAESLQLISRQGYQRLLVKGGAVDLEQAAGHPDVGASGHLTVIQDRFKLGPSQRPRFIEACEQAYHFGKSRLAVHLLEPHKVLRFSNHRHCAECDLEYDEPTPALFSFNHPLGACPACKGFGRIITIDYDLAMPDRSLSLAQGLVKPWRTGTSAECQADLAKFCRKRDVPMDVPFNRMPPEQQEWVIQGDPGYGKDPAHEWPRAWYGVRGFFRWLEGRAYKMHVRVLLSRYRAYSTCPECRGNRLRPQSLLYHLTPPGGGRPLTLADFYALPIRDSWDVIRRVAGERALPGSGSLAPALEEVVSRLGFLVEVGLGYLTLDRATRTLSGGETQRVNLTACLGARLVNTLFVLDEPSIGLHARDTHRLVGILQRLSRAGNTVVVVEHEAAVMRTADQIVDLGPGHGETGGNIVFQGAFSQILHAKNSLTGKYLSGREEIPCPIRRPVRLPAKSEGAGETWTPALELLRVTRHNLRDIGVRIPLGRLVCVTGVSGSGKTTLIREVLFPLLQARLSRAGDVPADEADPGEAPDARAFDGARLAGSESLSAVTLVDQTLLARTPRSNPALYVGAFDYFRELFAASDVALSRGLNSAAFSFNSRQGQCELCRGAGFEKIEMQFLSDVFVRCPECEGRRYRSHVLDVRIGPAGREWNIAELLDATVDDAIAWLEAIPASRGMAVARASLQLLCDVGLGYLRLGQPLNTLSGGESQRLKLVSHLAGSGEDGSARQRGILFLLDEPTTGLHFHDVRILLGALQRLVDRGDSVVVIEHNLDVIKCADWVIDLGPEAGDSGGQIVVEGTPESVAACGSSHTGRALASMLTKTPGKARSRQALQ
jgi:excinuclease ABC subunit A